MRIWVLELHSRKIESYTYLLKADYIFWWNPSTQMLYAWQPHNTKAFQAFCWYATSTLVIERMLNQIFMKWRAAQMIQQRKRARERERAIWRRERERGKQGLRPNVRGKRQTTTYWQKQLKQTADLHIAHAASAVIQVLLIKFRCQMAFLFSFRVWHDNIEALKKNTFSKEDDDYSIQNRRNGVFDIYIYIWFRSGLHSEKHATTIWSVRWFVKSGWGKKSIHFELSHPE
jgi:hypothetical protein